MPLACPGSFESSSSFNGLGVILNGIKIALLLPIDSYQRLLSPRVYMYFLRGRRKGLTQENMTKAKTRRSDLRMTTYKWGLLRWTRLPTHLPRLTLLDDTSIVFRCIALRSSIRQRTLNGAQKICPQTQQTLTMPLCE